MYRLHFSKGKRSVYFILALLALLGAFFLLLYFHIRPSNQDRVSRDVFNILRSSAENITAETGNYLFLCNQYTDRVLLEEGSGTSAEKVLSGLNRWMRENRLPVRVEQPPVAAGTEEGRRQAEEQDDFRLVALEDSIFWFEKVLKKGWNFRYRIPLHPFLKQLEMDQQQEFVDSYLLVSGDQVVYRSRDLSIAPGFQLDSFIKKNNRFSSGTTLVPVDEEQHRIFYYPFRLGGRDMLLCGVLKERDYQAALFRLNDGFIYVMVTILVLLILTQPILKLPLMSMHEPVRFSGLVLFVGAVFAGVSAITLLTVHILMLTGGSERAETNLREISAQMIRGFNYEVWKALKVSDIMDRKASMAMQEVEKRYAGADGSRGAAGKENAVIIEDALKEAPARVRGSRNAAAIKADPRGTAGAPGSRHIAAKEGAVAKRAAPEEAFAREIAAKEKEMEAFLDSITKLETATEIDRVFWIDAHGVQRMKVERNMEGVGNLNVGDRDYFRQVMTGRTYTFRLYEEKSFSMEALRNRVNGAFRMVLGQKSRWDGKVVAVSTRMSTWCDPLLPRGYGFCLVDANGLVQVHEKESKNLKENLFDRLPEPGMLKDVIRGGKPVFRKNILLYGSNADVYIAPVKDYPYFLVTWYRKDEARPVVWKILMFTLLHVALIYGVYLLAWMVYFGKRFGMNHRLFAPIHLVGWAIPSEKLWSFYLRASVFLLVSISGVITAMALASRFMYGNALVFTLVAGSPFLVVSGLALIYARERKLRNIGRWMRWSFFSAHTLVTLNLLIQAGFLVVASVVFGPTRGEWWFLLLYQFFQWLVMAWPLSAVPGRKWVEWLRAPSRYKLLNRRKYRAFYFSYLFFLVLVVGVLPPSLLTWMSHNIEIEQQVRKQELSLAERLGERLNRDTSYHRIFPVGTWNTRNEPPLTSPARRKAESYGYFSPVPFRASLFRGPFPKAEEEISEPYYYDVSELFSAKTRDPGFYPVLPDVPGNGQWAFSRKVDTVLLWYRSLLPLRDSAGIFIQMETGPRFVYFNLGTGGVCLTVFVLLILVLLALTLRYGVFSFFLWKYLAAAGRAPSSLLIRWREQVPFDAFLNANSPERLRDDRERAIMQNVDRNRTFFEFIWESCSDKEKFLLYDFAADGLMNFKNSYEITKLVEKGILTPHRRLDVLRLFSPSFRLFLLTKKNSAEMTAITRKYNRSSPLGVFRFALVVVAVAFFSFIFFTQNDVFDKILALTAGIVSVLANLSRITGVAAEKPAQ